MVGDTSGRPAAAGTSAPSSRDAVMASRSDSSFPGVTGCDPGSDGNRTLPTSVQRAWSGVKGPLGSGSQA
jgi:hypothetical protein